MVIILTDLWLLFHIVSIWKSNCSVFNKHYVIQQSGRVKIPDDCPAFKLIFKLVNLFPTGAVMSNWDSLCISVCLPLCSHLPFLPLACALAVHKTWTVLPCIFCLSKSYVLHKVQFRSFLLCKLPSNASLSVLLFI